MNSAIVTGATGFVGVAVVKALVQRGIKVYAVVRKEDERSAKLAQLSNVRIVVCGMDQYSNLPQKIADQRPETFFHFAWTGSSGPLRGDDAVQLANIRYTCDAVRAAAASGCKTFVMAGSIMEYEIEAQMRTEQTPAITTIYCSAKKAADFMARALSCELGLSYICGLISNIYGPGETSPRLINTSLRRLLAGEHMAFSSGEQMYDFIYITDAATAFAEIGEKGLPNKTYYIGSKQPQPLKNFLLEMRNVTAPNVELGLGELPFNGISLTYHEFNVNAVYEDTGFEPQVSFSQGIRNTVQWLQSKE